MVVLLAMRTALFNIGGERKINAVEASVEAKQADTAGGRKLAGEIAAAAADRTRERQSRRLRKKVSRAKQANR